MSASIAEVAPLVVDGIKIVVVETGIKLTGVLSMRSPAETLTPFLQRVHLAAVEHGAKTLTVDMTELRFMNSSSIRSLVDWIEWIRCEPEARRYTLHFVTKPGVSWQSTTLSAICAFGGDLVSVTTGS